ncbi:DUF2802 domain-containing protein [Colwellia sp. MEBiC06753]
MQLEISVLLIVVVIFLAVIALLFLKVQQLSKALKITQSQLTATEMLTADMQVNISSLYEQHNKFAENSALVTTEHEQVSKQLEHRIKAIQVDCSKLSQAIQQLQEAEPLDKFYTRASKLAALGADAEEIMKECDLPRAEVEMLLSIYKQGLK